MVKGNNTFVIIYMVIFLDHYKEAMSYYALDYKLLLNSNQTYVQNSIKNAP